MHALPLTGKYRIGREANADGNAKYLKMFVI
jgi:hypothetical protein